MKEVRRSEVIIGRNSENDGLKLRVMYKQKSAERRRLGSEEEARRVGSHWATSFTVPERVCIASCHRSPAESQSSTRARAEQSEKRT